MRYTSTRGNENILPSREAVLKGLSPDGGLFMPLDLDFHSFKAEELYQLPYREMAERILSFFFDDFSDIKEVVRQAYENSFDTEEITPVKAVGDHYVLELFHGPTLAFKDVALQLLPRLMAAAAKETGSASDILILTATSGDTGKAAMEGFKDVPGIRILVFYPYGGVSPVQQLQMTTQRGNNVRTCAVRGNFDDAQTGVKQIFETLSETCAAKGTVLSSANSINIGRLVPQIVYYFKAYSDLIRSGRIAAGDPVNFTVPTGNFGDILAGYFARCMGLPVKKLICASNTNNILTDFLTTGVYDRNRPFYKTISPSMDILVSSNLERLLYMLSGNDASYTASLMRDLSEKGRYEVTPELLQKIRETFACGFADDEATKKTIGRVFKENGYLMDPHTAIAWAVSEDFSSSGDPDASLPNIVLSTASPYKFPQAVSDSLRLPLSDSEFELMDAIRASSGVPIPENLAELRTLPVRFTDVITKEEMNDFVLKLIEK
ncbi:MAG: threonine synthase [Lachnospiraceae bacterium]|nr:threonine synthase [Lachnospiraceae bacterium]